jgi:hypothetical protein
LASLAFGAAPTTGGSSGIPTGSGGERMTPNTTIYMIAGFVVILLGVIFYALSLALRVRKLNQKIKKF